MKNARPSTHSHTHVHLLGILSLACLLLSSMPASAAGSPAASSPKEVTRDALPARDQPSRPMPSSPPNVSLSVPAQSLLGQDVSFTVTFDNADPADTGYGPILDVILDTTGADGDDGLGTTSIAASYLGSAFTASGSGQNMWVLTFDGAGQATHPLMRDASGAYITVSGTPGDTLVVLRLPFGSFTPGQPPATVDMTVNMSSFADLGTALSVQARGGYEFGYTPLDDWCCGDAPDNTLSGFVSDNVTPTLFTLSKAYAGPEDEAASGPNFRTFYPTQYTVTVDIAPGQSLTSLTVNDALPSNLQYYDLISSSPGGASCSEPTDPPPPPGTPGGTLSCSWGSPVSGSASLSFDFYIPRDASGGGRVINPATGDEVTSCDNASVSANWTPLDARDAAGPVSESPSGCEHALTDKSIALQKSVANLTGGGNAPGDVLEYTLSYQISDFFAFEGVTLSDMLSDGQHVDGGFTPTLSVNGNSFSLGAAPMNGANYDVICNYSGGPGLECTANDPAADDGTTTLTFRLSDELISRGQPSGRYIGGCVDPAGGSADPICDLSAPGGYNDGPTYATLRFRAVILDSFTDDYPSGDPSVDQGDVLGDSATIDGALLDTDTLTPNGAAQSDGSGAGLSISTGTLSKNIYAVNGAAPGSPVEIKPGDEVTYRITYVMPTGDEENLRFDDYLPLPIFQVGDPDDNGTSGPGDPPPWTFDPTLSTGVSDVPAPGEAMFGPSDTFYSYTCLGTGTPAGCLAPALTSDIVNNSLTFDYGDFDGPDEAAYTVDLLFTVTVNDDPFADRLQLTNQAHAFEGSTNAGTISSDEIVQLTLTEPVLLSNKAAIWSSNSNAVFDPTAVGPVTFLDPANAPRWSGTINSTNLAATPINSDVSGVDAGDVVSFAIVIENTGSSLKGAFDLIVRDDLPAPFEIPSGGPNLQVYYGDGSGPIGYNGLGGGPDGVDGTQDDLFGSGIELVDPVGQGVCQAHDPNSGNNIILITFDLQLGDAVSPGTIVNTESLVSYAGSEGGPNHLATPQTDTAETTVVAVTEKALDGTEVVNANNAADQVAIGEFVTYTLTLTIPEGETPDAQLVDTLDAGLAFVQVDGVVTSPDVSHNPISTGATPTNVTIGSAGGGTGNQITFDLGTITNANRDNSVAETIAITYTAVTVNVAGNQDGTPLTNSAVLSWNGGSLPTASAPSVTVIEPLLRVVKTPSPSQGDAGDTISFTLTIDHGPGSSTDAYEMSLSDAIPAGMTYAGNLDCTGGALTPDTCAESAGTLTATWTNPSGFPLGSTTVISFDVTLDDDVTPGQVITNQADLTWTGMSGDVGTARSTHNPLSVERTGDTGDVGGAANDYATSATADVTITPGADKSLASTSEPHTAADRLAIGEIARFRLQMTLPEGQAPNFQLRDLLPPGLLFLDDSTVTLAFVSDGSSGGVTSDSLSGGGLEVTGDETTVDSITPAFVLPGTAISGGGSPGADVTFSLGLLTNADRDANQEFVVLEFNALLSNVAGNQSGVSRGNQFEVLVSGSVVDTSNVTSVVVAEPSVTLAKALTTTPADAGDALTYTLTLSNTSGANAAAAFDLAISDTLSAYLDLQSVSVALPGGGGGTCGATAQSFSDSSTLGVGGTAAVAITCLNPGESAVLTLNAVVVSAAPAAETIPNTAMLAYSSLPGGGTSGNPTGSDTPGGSGSANGERDGSGGVNDYSSTDNVDVTLAAPAIDKQVLPAEYVIGDTIVFDLLITLPEGVTTALEVYDDLPTGLSYVSHQVITSAAASGGLLAADFNGTLPAPTVNAPGGSGGDLTLTFGDSTSVDDNDTTNNAFLVRVTALVLNLAGNQNGTSLVNSAELRYQANGSPAVRSDSETITVLEPELSLAKLADDDTPAFGETVTYTLTIQHLGSSAADAYDLALTDAIPTVPPGLSYVAGSLTHTAGAAPTTLDDSGAPALTASWDSLPLGASSTITYQVTVGGISAVNLGDAFVNNSALTWSSLAGANPDERDGSGGVNDYRATASETITVTGPDLSITKDDGSISGSPGGVVVYTLTFRNNGNAGATGVVINEIVPANSTFNAAGSTAGWSCADGAPPSSACSFTPDVGFGPGVLPASAGSSVQFAVRVDDPLPAGVEQLANNASVADDGTNGAEPTPTDNADSDTTPLVAAPDLRVTKDDGADTLSPGETTTYTITVENVGDQDATGVVLTDTLPANIAFVSASDGGAQAAGVITWPAFDLAAGASITRMVTITVNDPFPVGVDTITNTAAAADDGTNGADQNPSDNQDDDIDNVVTLGNVDLTKTLSATSQAFTSDPLVAIGEILTYQVVLTIPPGTISGVTVADVLDQGLAFVDCLSVTPSSGNLTTTLTGSFAAACNPNPADPPNGNPTVLQEPSGSSDAADDGRRVVFDLGDITNSGGEDETLTIAYQAVVLDNASNVRGVNLNNAVLWDWDTGNLARAASDVTILEPTLSLSKSAAPRVAPPGAPITFTLNVEHDPSSDSPAYDLVLTDTLPPELTYVPGSLSCTSGICSEASGVITVTWDSFGLAETSEVTFQATLINLPAGRRVTNEVSLEWTSLPDDNVSAPYALSPYNALATERRYDPSSAVDLYRTTARVTVRTPDLPETGFAPGILTRLPRTLDPVALRALGGLRLEIPGLGVSMPIVGVSTDETGWDLTWLWNRVGYLEGTAFPTHPGNTALTAHVVLPNGLPGPFARLSELRWGDEIWVESGDLTHVYQVRSVRSVRPSDLSVLSHKELDWLTLITCEGYQPASGNYLLRKVVQAVLVEVRPR